MLGEREDGEIGGTLGPGPLPFNLTVDFFSSQKQTSPSAPALPPGKNLMSLIIDTLV